MDEYKHGLYREHNILDTKTTENVTELKAPVYVGCAPIHTVADGLKRVNVPVLLTSFTQAVRTMGYSEDWAAYPLCEAMYTHLALERVGPIVVINVFDPKGSTKQATKQVTGNGGQIVLSGMGLAVLDSIVIEGKTRGTNYAASYDYTTGAVTLKPLATGALTGELNITYDEVDPGEVQAADVVGTENEDGTRTGLEVIRSVYAETGYYPSRILAPGYSGTKLIHDKMLEKSMQVNGHFDMFISTDIPLLDGQTPMTPARVHEWKEANGYSADNEKTHWPMWQGNDGRVYHLSVLACAVQQRLDAQDDGVPYQSSSNQEMPVGGHLYFGADRRLMLDEQDVNETLCRHGITSAIYHGGRWVLWGAHSASYGPETATDINVAETNLMMLYHITNDFQRRRAEDIDRVTSKNRLAQIAAEETARLDAMVAMGQLAYGRVTAVLGDGELSDIVNGDFKFDFEITVNPLSKSMTARVTLNQERLREIYAESAE